MFVDEFTPGDINLRIPFLRESYSLPTHFPNSINLLDFSLHELGRFHNLTYLGELHYTNRGYDRPREHFWSENFDKLVLFPNGLAVIAFFEEGKLGMFRLKPRFNDVSLCDFSEWKILHDGKGFNFDDIVEFKGRVLGIDRRGRVYEIVYHAHNSFQINPVVLPIASGGGWQKRLVESLGLLYLVVRCNVNPSKTDRTEVDDAYEKIENSRKTKFKVYELNEKKNKWCESTSIGDRSFIMGLDFSFSATAHELGTCEKNSILFTLRSFRSYSRKMDDYKLFRKGEEIDLCIAVYHLNDPVHTGVIGPYPSHSNMLWPPPPWMWSVIDRSKRLETLETAINETLDSIPEDVKTKVKEITLKGTRAPLGNSLSWGTLKAVEKDLKLKEVVMKLQDGEKKFMDLEKLLKSTSTDELRDSIDMLNQIESLLVRDASRTDELRAALEKCDNGDAPPHLIKHVLREHDALLFELEECVSEMEMYHKPMDLSTMND